MLRTIVFALQKAFDIGGDLLPLRSEFLATGKFLGCGYAIAAGTLGNVHAGIGHADDVLNRETMHRETGYAETAGDVMFAEHGVLRNPLAQAFGQDFSLLGAGFRHEDDELISTVAGDDVGLPRLLLEQASYAGEDKITFEVAHGVIHFFELVEVDEDHGERPAGA